MMNYQEKYELWKNDNFFDEVTQAELAALDIVKDYKEIEDRFYCDLEFGTGGLRGVMAAGTNRMNRYTVGKATVGLGKYLENTYSSEKCTTRGVAVAYDTRNHSAQFAQIAADVLTAMNIKAYLFTVPVPTPELSFAVSHLGCIAGVVITASHNPKEYNGYKVYDENGCQLVPKQAKNVIAFVNEVNDYTSINFAGNDALLLKIDCTDAFVEAAMRQSLLKDMDAKAALKIVYTPLYGTGYVPVQKLLAADGFTEVTVVREQALPNGDFPTIKSPNPEEKETLQMGLKLAEIISADIVFGTDPDSDRVGVGVRDEQNHYQLLTGNQIGALLIDYVVSSQKIDVTKKPAVIKTVVTSELGAAIARKHGMMVFDTLTGFKFIGEKITQFEKARQEKNEVQDYSFVMGYEESYGYLIGTHARDKDAVVSVMLIAEMAATYKKLKKTLWDRLSELYTEYGYYLDEMDNFTLRGKEGLEKIAAMMSSLRAEPMLFSKTEQCIDYSVPVTAEEGFGDLPTSNVLKYVLKNGSWIAVRPSGTEPKIKIYYSIKAPDAQLARKTLSSLRMQITRHLGLDYR